DFPAVLAAFPGESAPPGAPTFAVPFTPPAALLAYAEARTTPGVRCRVPAIALGIMINDELGLCGMRFSLPMLHMDNPAGLLIVGHGVVPNRLGILADAPPSLARTLDRCRPLRLLAAILRAVPKLDPPAALTELLDAPLIHTVWVNGSVLWPKYSLDPA